MSNTFFLGVFLLVVLVLLVVIKKLYVKNESKNRQLNNLQQILFVLKKMDSREEFQEDYLQKRLRGLGYGKIAIYGCSVIGKRICRTLENSGVEVACFVDKNASRIQMKANVVEDVTDMPQVDCIIITVVSHYYAIKKELESKTECPIILVEDLL